MVKTIIKSTYIFNDIHFVSKLYIIKVSPKSNIVIIWIDIWNFQCGSLAKMLINQCFNVGSYITMVQGAYMNSSISQCKNCQKQRYTTFACKTQESRYIKYNGPHKLEHHHHFAQYCKVNFKINLFRIETKQHEPYSYWFKYLNCKGDHQANSNTWLFQKHYFNKERHIKKYQEIQKTRKNLICSAMSNIQA